MPPLSLDMMFDISCRLPSSCCILPPREAPRLIFRHAALFDAARYFRRLRDADLRAAFALHVTRDVTHIFL